MENDISKYQNFIGHPVKVLEQALYADGKYLRIVNYNNQPRIVGRDYNISRLNIAIKNGIVVEIINFG